MADRRETEREVRRRRPRTSAGIPFATVEALAARMHGVGVDGEAALRARLHSLRRLDFPNGVSGSSGRHFDYGLADLIGVLAALELAEAYVPPAAAVAIVREGWPEIARGALAGIAGPSERGLVTVLPNGLFQALARTGDRISDTLHVETAGLAAPPTSIRGIELAAGSMARLAMGSLPGIDRKAADLARGQLSGFEARFGSGTPLPRPSTSSDRLASEGPYWNRAQSLIDATAGGVVADVDRRRAAWHLSYVARPAPVEAWKTRVEVDPDLDDVGFGAALTSLACRAGVHPALAPTRSVETDRIWRRLVEKFGASEAVAARLFDITTAGRRLSSGEKDGATIRQSALGRRGSGRLR